MDKVISRTISEIDKVKNENLELNDKLNIARAENEKLKTDIAIYKGIIDSDKAENERLKASLKISHGLCKTLEKAKSNEHEQWFIRCCEINTERDKYRSTLQEIREIAEKMYNTNDEDTERDLHIELQAKINEVIGEK